MRAIRYLSWLVLGLIVLPLTASAQGNTGSPQDTLPLDRAVTVGTLENGLRYYIRTNQRPEARAELRLVVNAGSVLEDDDQQGLAHLVEHMAFNGTLNFEKQELVDYMESVGMGFGPEINAGTGFDQTVYMLQVPTDDPEILATAFQILEDWAHQVSFEPEEIDKERGVVIEEWRLGRGANARMADQQFPVLFRGSRYAERLPIGRKEILETFPHEALVRFYRDWYRPDLMAVVAVGDFDSATVEQLILTHFSRIPGRSDPRPRPTFDVPAHDETLFAIASDPEATTSQVALVFKQALSESGTLASYRQSLVESLYNGMLNNRLFELSRSADPPFVAGASAKGRMVRSAEVYQLLAIVPEGGIPRGMRALLTEAERVARHGFASTELDREKADLLRGMEQAFAERENRDSRLYASEYVGHFLQREPSPGIEFEYEATQALLPSISLEEVNALAREWLTDRNRVVLVNSPEKEGLTIPDRQELDGIFEQTATAEIDPYEDEVTADPLIPTAPVPGAVVKEDYMQELDLTEWTLENGVRVLLKPTDFKDDEVVVQAYSPGGYSLATLDEHMSATTAAQLVVLGGLGAFDQVDLEKKLAGKAVRVSPSIGELTEGLTGSASPKDLETLFQLIHLYFVAPRRDETAFQAFQRQVEAVLSNRSASPMAAFQDTLTVTLSQAHPRARPVSVESFQEVDLDEAFAFYRDRFADASDFSFVFVGALDFQTVRPLVETYLGGLPALRRQESWRDLDIDPPTGVIRKTVRKGLEPQSRTQILFTGPFEWSAENRLGMRLMTNALEIRLREVIREDMSGTYGVSVTGMYERDPEGAYTVGISFGADPDRIDELTQAVFEEVRRFQEEGPTPEDVQKVTEQERRDRETNLQENRWWATQLRFADQYGADPRFLLDMSLLDGASRETIQRDARRYLRMDNYIQVTLMPEREEPGRS